MFPPLTGKGTSGHLILLSGHTPLLCHLNTNCKPPTTILILHLDSRWWSLATASCPLSSHGLAGCVKSWGWPDQLPTSARLRHLITCMKIMTRQIQAMFDKVQNVEYNIIRLHQLSDSMYCIVFSILIILHHCLHFDYINTFNDTNLLWSSQSGQSSPEPGDLQQRSWTNENIF